MRFHDIVGGLKKRACVCCGKTLSFMEGYCHPTLGKDALLCWHCYEQVERSVEQWRRFILNDAENPESPYPSFLNNYSFHEEDLHLKQKKIKE